MTRVPRLPPGLLPAFHLPDDALWAVFQDVIRPLDQERPVCKKVRIVSTTVSHRESNAAEGNDGQHA